MLSAFGALAAFAFFGPARLGRSVECSLASRTNGNLPTPCTVTDSAYYVRVRNWVYVVPFGPYGSSSRSEAATSQEQSPYVLIALPAAHFYILGDQWFRKNISGGDQQPYIEKFGWEPNCQGEWPQLKFKGKDGKEVALTFH